MAAPQRRARSPLQQQLRTRATIRASAVLRLPTGTRRFFSLPRSARRPPDGPAKAPSTTLEGLANRAKGCVLHWHRRLSVREISWPASVRRARRGRSRSSGRSTQTHAHERRRSRNRSIQLAEREALDKSGRNREAAPRKTLLSMPSKGPPAPICGFRRRMRPKQKWLRASPTIAGSHTPPPSKTTVHFGPRKQRQRQRRSPTRSLRFSTRRPEDPSGRSACRIADRNERAAAPETQSSEIAVGASASLL